MSKLSLSVVMATYDDFHGVYFTVQALRMYLGRSFDEIVIIDNNPDSRHGETTKNFAKSLGDPRVIYKELRGVNSTAISRNVAIETATSDIVVCIDPHVLLVPGALESVREYFSEEARQKDLVQGPLLYDNGVEISTHFNLDIWRGQMWGVWDTDLRGNGAEPFDIPAQGLGAFAVVKKHWLKFSLQHRGFGGEEGYIHIKYRNDGRRTVCVPRFLWSHRFGRPDGAPYPLTNADKVRNYVNGFKELGLDIQPIKDHFVGTNVINELDWLDLKEGRLPTPAACGACVGARFATIQDWASYVREQPSDINEHGTTLAELARNRRVVDYGTRTGVSSVALASGYPATYTMLNPAEPPEFAHINKHLSNKEAGEPIHCSLIIAKQEIEEVPECDLLFIDMAHNADWMGRFLEANAPKVRDYIVMHDTVIFGEVGDNGGPGLMHAVRAFVRANPRWSVARHYQNQYGLLVLVGNDELKPKVPNTLTKASNFAKALTRHVVGGMHKVNLEVYETRLAQCDLCPSRNNEHCSECGCPIEKKASWEQEQCPLAKW